MLRLSALVVLSLLIATPIAAETVVAQNATSQEQFSSDLAIANLKLAIERSLTNSGNDDLEVYITNGRLLVRLINGNLNEAGATEREGLAVAIASVVSAQIVGKLEFKTMLSLQVEFVRRRGVTDQIVDAIEFREDPNGGFKHHRT